MSKGVMAMKRLLVLLLVVLATALGTAASAPAASPHAGTARPVAALHSCSSRYVHAIVEGKHKCLGTGQFCALRNQRVYRRSGFICKPGSDGRLRLHRR